MNANTGIPFSALLIGGTCTSTFDVNNANQNQHTACDCSTAQVAGLDVDLWGEYCEVLDVRASRSSGPDREVATAFIVVVIIIFVCSAIVFVVMGFKRGQRESTDVVQQHHHTDSMGPTIAELEQSDNGEFT